ncbi:MAG TPA: lipopolysaccharide transport periplasmic protein LptA [Chiayiivirga sp.]|nr:lipopolysaccharide transport periplasmic protein LptA [Chiayiivirga sp.]
MTPPRRNHAAERLALLALSLVLACPAAWSRSTDRDQALSFDAKGADAVLQNNGESRFSDVTITQGTLEIRAATAVVTKNDGEVTRVVLEGEPASLQQENDAGERMRAQARRIEYDTATEVVVLTGAVRIDQNRDTFRAERVRYDTRNGQISGDGGPGDGRIHLTIQPKTKPAGG